MATVQGEASSVAHKIHLEGLQKFGPEDITSYLTEHFPSPPPERVERVDATSANIVYKIPAVALQALGQITLLADGSLSPSQLRAAKPFSTRPNDNLQVRLALATDQKDVKGFYGLEYLRVQQAALYSRYASTKEWQRLGDSYYSGEDKDELTVPWNVEQIRFATDFVQVEQHAQRYKHKTGQTGSSLTKDEFRWQVKLPLKTLTEVTISEAKVEDWSFPIVTIRFKLLSAPHSADNSEKAMIRITGEASDDEIAENLEAQEVLEGADVKEKSSDEGEIAEENPVIEDRPSTFPLARLFEGRNSSEGMEIRLDFKRSGAGSTSPYKWIWPAVIRFFGAREKWIPIKKKKEYNTIFGIENFKLDEWLGNSQNRNSCGARVSREQVAEDRCEWVLGPLPRTQDQSSANPAVQVSQGSSDIGGKRKHEEKPAGEIDDPEILDAQILSSQQYLEECERIWRQKRQELEKARQEEAKACNDYLAAAKQLDELRSRRDDAIRKGLHQDGQRVISTFCIAM